MLTSNTSCTQASVSLDNQSVVGVLEAAHDVTKDAKFWIVADNNSEFVQRGSVAVIKARGRGTRGLPAFLQEARQMDFFIIL